MLHTKLLRAHMILLLLCALCLGVATSCAKNNDPEPDYFDFNKNESCIEGVALSEGSVDLYLTAGADDIEQTDSFLRTNTKKIVVTSAGIEKSAEIELFLFARENVNEPIGYATLSEHKTTVTFSNLTSATAYKVGGKICNGTTPNELTISD